MTHPGNARTSLLLQGRWYLTGAALLITVAAVSVLLFGKEGTFLWLNGFHPHWLNRIISIYTNIGDGLFAVVLALVLFFFIKQRKPALDVLVAWAATGIVAQIIKRLVFSPRPLAYFQPRTFPFYINEIIHGGNNSFPSGHTVTAFAVATVLAMYFNKAWQQWVWLLLATAAGFSRIYLSQHFLTDVLAGALLGIGGALVCMYCTRNIREQQLSWQRKG